MAQSLRWTYKIKLSQSADTNTPKAPQTLTDSDESENAPLLSNKRVPGKIIPDRLEITFGDKTSSAIFNKKIVARNAQARKAQKPRGTLNPQWKLYADATITN